MAAGVVAGDDEVIESSVVPTNASPGVRSTLERMFGIVRALVARSRQRGVDVLAVGLASAGMIDPVEGRLTTATEALPGWSGVSLREELEHAIGLPAVVVNDVHALALAESRLGVAVGANDVLYVAVGTGIGGALVRSGALVSGAHGYAGDIGHVVVDVSPGAELCPCGRRGHLEAYASGPALAARYSRRGATGSQWDLRAVARQARDGEKLAADVLREGGELLGRVLGGVVNLVDPELIVFGGGLAELEDALFWDFVAVALDAEVRARVRVPCRRTRLGANAAVIGAALAARDRCLRNLGA